MNENVTNTKKNEKKYTTAQKIFKESRDYFVILILFMLVYILCFRVVIVVGDSMFDTLVDGDYLVLISNVFYTEPKYGDIIVASKDSFRNGECIVKRVIATEGQEVDIDFENGIVYVDGEALQEDYIYSETKLYEGISFPLTVSEGCLFVLGDNRMDSKDSRSPEIGLIDKREVLGKAVFLLYPGDPDDNGSAKRDLGRIGGLY
jgi:signal peptidase I